MISIIVAYYNRRYQLEKTLESIWYYGNPDIIVVDDESTERIDDIKGITLWRLENKHWSNPCVPYNIGFSKAKGDIIIIQNPECLHVGNILSKAGKIKKGELLSFAAYSLDYTLEYKKYNQKALRKQILSEPQRIQQGHHGWYNHSVYRPCALHFCNAILREDLERIGGFDERYSQGICFDDDDMIMRVQRAGMKVKIIDDPFVIHQKHERTDYEHKWGLRMINHDIFQEAIKEKTIKPPSNKYYGA